MLEIIGSEPGEWLTQRRAQREERERPAQLVGCSCCQGKTLPCCLADGLVQQQGLAYPRLSLHQHDTTDPLLSPPQQVTDYPPLGLTSAHSLIAGISRPRRSSPACSRRGVTDHRCHVIASREPDVCSAGGRGWTISNAPASARGPGSDTGSANASRAIARAQRIRITAVSG